MDEKHVCAFCRSTGKFGAQWILYIGTDSHRVHKFCGEKLKEEAPKGTDAFTRLVPNKELARTFRAQSFWKKNFHGNVASAQTND